MKGLLISPNEIKHHLRHHISFFTNGVINVLISAHTSMKIITPCALLVSPS